MAEPVEAFDGQSQSDEQPSDEQAVGFMMADVLQAVAILGIVEPFLVDLPAGFGQTEQRGTADLVLPFGITVTYFRNAIKLPGQAPWH